MRRILPILIVLLLLLTGCTSTPAEVPPITSGSFDDLTYHNSYFGLTFTMTKNWDISTNDKLAERFEIDESLLGDDLDDEHRVMLVNERWFPLCYASKFPVGKSIEITPSFEFVAIRAATEDETPMDYIDLFIKAFEEGEVPHELVTKEDITLNDTPFAYLEMTITDQRRPVTQRTYCTIREGYALTLTTTYSDQDDGEDIDTIISSIMLEPVE